MPLSAYYQNKVVLITGGSQGIGKELAKQVLQNGGRVVITGRDAHRLEKAKAELSGHDGDLMAIVSDAAQPDAATDLVRAILAQYGQLDVVICNAGVTVFGDIQQTEPAVVDRIIDTNLKGGIYLCIAAADALRRSKGAIVFVSSVAAFRGIPKYALYSVSKMGLTAFVQSIRHEFKSSGVFAGIAYVNFTENEPDKKTIQHDGTLKNTPKRMAFLLRSREMTAHLILEQVAKRRHVVMHTFTGWMTYQLSRWCPGVLHVLYGIYNKRINNLREQ